MVGWIWKRAAISDVVWSPLRAAKATLDLNDALYCLRFLLMILLLVGMMNQSLGTCPNFGVHFTPTKFTERLLQAIVGVEIKIETLTGKLKASQNQPEKNRAGVKTGLETGEGAQDRAMAKLIS